MLSKSSSTWTVFSLGASGTKDQLAAQWSADWEVVG